MALSRYSLAYALLTLLMATSVPSYGASYLDSAQEYFDQKDFPAAIIELKNAIQEHPNLPEARLLLGRVHLARENHPAAESELERARHLGANPDLVSIPLVRSYLAQQKFTKVISYTQNILSDSREVASELFALRGTALLGVRNVDAARSSFQQSLQTAANNHAQLGLARIALAEGNTPRVVVLTEKVIATGHDLPDARLLLGRVKLIQQNTQAAIEQFSQGLAQAPNHQDLLTSRAEAYLQAGKLDLAQADIERILSLSPYHPVALYLTARIQLQNGDFQAAQSTGATLLNAAPDHIPIHYLLGVAHYQLRQYIQAESHLKQFLRAAPDDPGANLLLAGTLLAQDQPQRAITILTRLTVTDANSSAVYAMLGHAHVLTGDEEKALEMTQKAVQLSPNNSQYRSQLAVMQLHAGQDKAAIDEIQQAVAIGSDGDRSKQLLVLTYIQTDRYEQALSTLDELRRSNPSAPLYPHLQGVTYRQSGNHSKAADAFAQALSLDPHYPLTRLELANQALSQNRPEEAEAHYQQLLEGNGDHFDALIALARLSWQKGAKKKSETLLKQAGKLRPDAFAPISLLAELHQLQANTSQAREVVDRFVDTYPNHVEALSLQAKIAILSQNYRQAIPPLRRLVDSGQATAQHHYLLAGLYARDKLNSQALKLLDINLEQTPQHQDSWRLRNTLLIEARQFEAAQSHIDALRKAQTPPALADHLQGDLLFARGHWSQAANAYKTAYESAPNGNRALSLSAAYTRAGQPEKATQALLRHLESNPEDSQTRTQLATLYQHNGQHQAAITHYQKVIQQQPNNTVALNNLAELIADQAPDQAIDYLERALQLAPEQAGIAHDLGLNYLRQGQTKEGLELLIRANRQAPDDLLIGFHLAVALNANGRTEEAQSRLQQWLEQPAAQQLDVYPEAQRLYQRLSP